MLSSQEQEGETYFLQMQNAEYTNCVNIWDILDLLENSDVSPNTISAFAWSGFGIGNDASAALFNPLLESAPEKCVFTNRVPWLRLKMNLITRTE